MYYYWKNANFVNVYAQRAMDKKLHLLVFKKHKAVISTAGKSGNLKLIF